MTNDVRVVQYYTIYGMLIEPGAQKHVIQYIYINLYEARYNMMLDEPKHDL